MQKTGGLAWTEQVIDAPGSVAAGFSSNSRDVERPELKREFQHKRKWQS